VREQDKPPVPINEPPVIQANHYFSNIGKPFQLGNRSVCWAVETCAHIGADMALTRRVILDAETEEEIDILDAGSHVVHAQPGQVYTIGQVIDSE